MLPWLHIIHSTGHVVVVKLLPAIPCLLPLQCHWEGLEVGTSQLAINRRADRDVLQWGSRVTVFLVLMLQFHLVGIECGQKRGCGQREVMEVMEVIASSSSSSKPVGFF